MTGSDLKTGRLSALWTQQKAASRFGLTQAYLSMVEQGRRPVTPRLAARAMERARTEVRSGRPRISRLCLSRQEANSQSGATPLSCARPA